MTCGSAGQWRQSATRPSGANPEALHEWVARLRERFGNRPVAIGIETSRGPVISALMAYDFIVLFR